jgi:hypothetical protein
MASDLKISIRVFFTTNKIYFNSYELLAKLHRLCVRNLFAWLKSSWFFCERKTLLNGWLICLIILSKQADRMQCFHERTLVCMS